MTKPPIRRNSPGWAADRFRSDALPRLIDDLVPLNEDGIPEQVCTEVKKALGEIINLASRLDDHSIWRRSVWTYVQDYRDTYSDWNDIKGVQPDSRQRRDRLIRKMRDHRNKIGTVCRKHSHVINTELDLKFIDAQYIALNNIVKAAPTTFVELGKAVSRYATRRGIAI